MSLTNTNKTSSFRVQSPGLSVYTILLGSFTSILQRLLGLFLLLLLIFYVELAMKATYFFSSYAPRDSFLLLISQQIFIECSVGSFIFVLFLHSIGMLRFIVSVGVSDINKHKQKVAVWLLPTMFVNFSSLLCAILGAFLFYLII